MRILTSPDTVVVRFEEGVPAGHSSGATSGTR